VHDGLSCPICVRTYPILSGISDFVSVNLEEGRNRSLRVVGNWDSRALFDFLASVYETCVYPVVCNLFGGWRSTSLEQLAHDVYHTSGDHPVNGFPLSIRQVLAVFEPLGGWSANPPRLGRKRTLGLCQETRKGAFHLAAIRGCAGQGHPESRRAVLIIGWDRSGQDQAQAVVLEGPARGTCCRLRCLNDSSESGK